MNHRSPAALAKSGLLLFARSDGERCKAHKTEHFGEDAELLYLVGNTWHLYKVRGGRFLFLMAADSLPFLKRAYPRASILADGCDARPFDPPMPGENPRANSKEPRHS
jgi:hypothetical protein